MAYIEHIAYHLGRRDEVPNQELAARLTAEKNAEGIAEIASYLDDKNKSIQSDCLKVLYEIGYNAPELITKYEDTFIRLLDSKNNRMVWGAMIALPTIAELFRLQKECRSIDFAKRAEEMRDVIRKAHIQEFKNILEERMSSLSSTAQKRLARVIKKM